MDSRAKALIDRLGRMKSERSLWESHWTEIAEIMSPMRNDFITQRQPGEKRMEKISDGTPGMAAANLASALWGMLTNSAMAWFELRLQDEGLNDERAVKVWLAEATRALRAGFASGGQAFYAQAVDLFSDLVHFGTAVFYVDEPSVTKPGLFFSCRPLSECFIAENEQERVDTLFRRYRWSARQAMQKWGDRNGAKVREAAERRPEDQFEFIHAVLPASEYDVSHLPQFFFSDGWRPQGGRQRKGMEFVSVYLCVEDGHIISESGYHEFPYQVPRWSQRSRSVYGDSPAMLALPDAKMLNRMSKATIVGAEKMVDPPLLTMDETAKLGIRVTRGGLIPGGLDAQGRRRYEPLVTNGQPQLGLELEEQRRQAIREAFYATLLLMTDQPGRTATEVLHLNEEKMRLMGPHLGRVQSEFLAPLIERVFALLARIPGALPEPPEEIVGQPLRVEYVSPVARAQRAGEAVAMVRTLETVVPLAQADPTVLDNFDGDEWVRVAGNAFGLPPKLLRAPEKVEQMREQRQRQQAAMAMSEQAPKVAGALKAGAEAQQIAEGQGKQGRAA